MARVKRKRNTIAGSIAKYYLYALIILGLSVLVGFLTYKFDFYFIWSVLILLGINSLYILYIRHKTGILKGGLQGEKRVMYFLKNLPKDYRVIVNKVIVVGQRKVEYDFIVIGEENIHVIEVKNYRGLLSGHKNSDELTQSYPGQKRNSKVVKNPLKQLDKQVQHLRKYLGDNGVNMKIFGHVYFTNPDFKVKLNEWDTRMVTNEDELYKRLTRQPAKDKSKIKNLYRVLK